MGADLARPNTGAMATNQTTMSRTGTRTNTTLSGATCTTGEASLHLIRADIIIQYSDLQAGPLHALRIAVLFNIHILRDVPIVGQ